MDAHAVEFDIQSMDDWHPDELYDKLVTHYSDNPNVQGTVNRVVQGVRIHPLAD